ncbi:MAG: GntR family transcriptional regulator [Marinobacter sp.]|nr:GntR family transcriptional regulator [Marinobacter sp.]
MNDFKPRETLTEQVAQHIENLIAFGQFASGERIYESAMAKQLDVSHGCVREALLLLEKRHLVRNVPRRGTFVTELDEYFVRSLYEVLRLYLTHTGANLARRWQPEDMEKLESLYQDMKEAAAKGDLAGFLTLGIEYTQASLTYADNYFILEAIKDLWPSARRCTFATFRQSNHQVLEDNLEHMRASIEAIRARDEAALADILERYARHQCEQVLKSLQAVEKAG